MHDKSLNHMPSTLLDRLLKLYPHAKRTTLRRMISSGRVRINGQRARTLNQPLQDHDLVQVNEQPQKPATAGGRSAAAAPTLPFPIVYEDQHLIVIDKPAGLLTCATPGDRRANALAMVRRYVAARDPRARVGLIHRLDRDASGLVVFSKNHQAYVSLKRQFFQHSVERIYLALVDRIPTPRSGTIDTRLVERADGTVHSTTRAGKGQRAITRYETIHATRGGAALLRVRLETGRKHQIRAHLAERGVPILNDPLYRDAGRKPQGRLMLAAVELSLTHPHTGRRMSFRIDPPPQLRPPITNKP